MVSTRHKNKTSDSDKLIGTSSKPKGSKRQTLKNSISLQEKSENKDTCRNADKAKHNGSVNSKESNKLDKNSSKRICQDSKKVKVNSNVSKPSNKEKIEKAGKKENVENSKKVLGLKKTANSKAVEGKKINASDLKVVSDPSSDDNENCEISIPDKNELNNANKRRKRKLNQKDSSSSVDERNVKTEQSDDESIEADESKSSMEESSYECESSDTSENSDSIRSVDMIEISDDAESEICSDNEKSLTKTEKIKNSNVIESGKNSNTKMDVKKPVITTFKHTNENFNEEPNSDDAKLPNVKYKVRRTPLQRAICEMDTDSEEDRENNLAVSNKNMNEDSENEQFVVNSSSDEKVESDHGWMDVKDDIESLLKLEEDKNCGDYEGIDGVSITISGGRLTKKDAQMEKLKESLKAECRSMYNHSNVQIHKVNLICLFAHMGILNETVENSFFKAFALSLIPDEFLKINYNKFNTTNLQDFLLWYKKWLNKFDKAKKRKNIQLFKMCLIIGDHGNSYKYQVLIAMLRALGLLTRLVVNLQPFNPKIDNVKCRNRYTHAREKLDLTISNIKQEKNSKKENMDEENSQKNKRKRSSSKKEPENEESTNSEINSLSKQYKKIYDKEGHNHWIEVFLESENEWITIDGYDIVICDPSHCETYATKPIQYVMSIDQDNKIKDLTFKYSSLWLTETKKYQLKDRWWKYFLRSNAQSNSVNSVKADVNLEKIKKNDVPLPLKISDYKNHPNFVIERDVLRMQALHPYPPPVLGYIREHPVYPRSYVRPLQSKDRWLFKNGREIIEGEIAMKNIEKRINGQVRRIDLFGKWQTKKIKPKLTPDGKVPRNSFGNIELYKPWMVPEGCVHIPIKGIYRIAKKFNIDAAPAVVEWDYGAHPHPLVQGIVTLAEHENFIREEWDKDQERLKKDREKRAEREKLKLKADKKIIADAKKKAKAEFKRTEK